ncbi:acyl-CoA dehydrogenase, partial [Streptomyces sp. NPDC087440]|uniref:acyl-CoA dehydrogenase n=1 Tax=Streptomyces sp. NPDC087440 TaxID=3365790 RepID=UPI0037FB8D5B
DRVNAAQAPTGAAQGPVDTPQSPTAAPQGPAVAPPAPQGPADAPQVRVDTLERALGPLGDPGNPLGAAALLAADARGELPRGAEEVLDGFGLNAEFVPAALGGRLHRMDVLGRVLRPVFRRDASLGFGYGLNCFFAATPVWTGGTAAQRRTVAGLLLAGQRVAVARHGTAHGNDFVRDEFTARPLPDGDWLLTGAKSGIANSSRARGLVLFARTGDGSGGRSHTVFTADRGALPPGSVEDLGRRETTGMRSAEFGGLRTEGLRLPASAVVAEAGDGYTLSLRSSLVIRGLIPSIVLAGADTALRTVAAFAVRARPDGRRALDVAHVRSVLTGAFLDLLISDAMALVATRALHLLPRETSVYAAAAAYLAPKIVAEAMDEMSAVLGEESFGGGGTYGMFHKQLRDLPVTSMGHAGSAGRQVSILPQLPHFARTSWFRSRPAPAALFRLYEDLPPLDLSRAALLGDGDPLAAMLVEHADREDGDGGPALAALARTFRGELAELRREFAAVDPGDRRSLASPRYLGLGDRYTPVFAAAAVLGVWRERCHDAPPGDFLADPAWACAALRRLAGRLGRALPERSPDGERRVLAEVLGRLHGGRSFDLYASPLA